VDRVVTGGLSSKLVLHGGIALSAVAHCHALHLESCAFTAEHSLSLKLVCSPLPLTSSRTVAPTKQPVLHAFTLAVVRNASTSWIRCMMMMLAGWAAPQ